MSNILAAERPPTFSDMAPLLTPRNDPSLAYQFFLNYIPSASLVQPNTLSDSDALSILCYTLVTTPESTHAWFVFKFFQGDALRASAGVDASTTPNSSPFTFPPPPFLADISKTVVEYWNLLEPHDIMDWAELAHDVRNAHTQLVASFSNRVTFDGKDWEDQRQYLARTLYYKWTGLQASHVISGTNVGASMYMPQYWTPTETNSQVYGEPSHGAIDPNLTTFYGQYP
ncbi:hypothetical protein CPB86DRAFT_820621 [Serendipita vermifera]|nr:hypothetical protein CPB86DRAFT_820621 [Serendipita vermifera]